MRPDVESLITEYSNHQIGESETPKIINFLKKFGELPIPTMVCKYELSLKRGSLKRPLHSNYTKIINKYLHVNATI